ncbi:hypothetical protein LTR36_009996 [Oleoguttula mirabilis]|uniref:EthD domain-containing protein n=1 Tax=Oleoguttula mirabilis TaxID=1507867 RepID=A0AAV9JRI0_9PEZI|nr:hypothetical protein LTR36_009996 [Oleoguttula mirabilis]
MAHTTPQALLKRRAGSTFEEFSKYYLDHHAKVALPWCLANGVTYYAQVRLAYPPTASALTPNLHGPLNWSSSATASKYPDINLADWDAVGVMAFPADTQFPSGPGKAYYENVIRPDERVFLFSEALLHLRMLEPGSVQGARVEEVIVGGRAVVAGWEEWRQVFDGYGKEEQR